MLVRRVCVLSLGFLPFACFSSDNSGPGPDSGFSFDAATFDAFFPDTSFPDGAIPDSAAEAAVDAPLDIPPAPVVVQVLSASGPEQGVNVVFQDATGAVITSGTTDATGRFGRVVPAGSMATVLLGNTANPNNMTVVGVQPGD